LQKFDPNIVSDQTCDRSEPKPAEESASKTKSLLSRQLDLCSDVEINFFSNFSNVSGIDSEEESKQVLIFKGSRDHRCHDFENIFRQKNRRKNWRILFETVLIFLKIDNNIGCLRKAPISSPKIVKYRRKLRSYPRPP
jgi:hypothetical protein